MSAFPGRGRFGGKPRTQREADAELPPSLVQPAPLLLKCPICHTPRCATRERILLWHGEWRDRKLWDCPGAGGEGLDLTKEADSEDARRAA